MGASDQEWYLGHGDNVAGPFSRFQLAQLFLGAIIPAEADVLLFRVGTRTWRTLSESLTELGLSRHQAHFGTRRRQQGQRQSLRGHLEMSMGGATWTFLQGVSISPTGLFINVKSQFLQEGDEVETRLHFSSGRTVELKALVVRENFDPKFPVGYGFKFAAAPAALAELNEELVAMTTSDEPVEPKPSQFGRTA